MAYQQGSSLKAVGLLQQLLTEDPDNQKLLLYLGNCHLAMGESKEAVRVFKKVTDELENNAVYTPRAQWYLALAYLQSKELGKAKEELQIIIENNGYQKKEAEELLKDIAGL